MPIRVTKQGFLDASSNILCALDRSLKPAESLVQLGLHVQHALQLGSCEFFPLFCCCFFLVELWLSLGCNGVLCSMPSVVRLASKGAGSAAMCVLPAVQNK